MVRYNNEYETKENRNWTKDKMEPQHVQQRLSFENMF